MVCAAPAGCPAPVLEATRKERRQRARFGLQIVVVEVHQPDLLRLQPRVRLAGQRDELLPMPRQRAIMGHVHRHHPFRERHRGRRPMKLHLAHHWEPARRLVHQQADESHPLRPFQPMQPERPSLRPLIRPGHGPPLQAVVAPLPCVGSRRVAQYEAVVAVHRERRVAPGLVAAGEEAGCLGRLGHGAQAPRRQHDEACKARKRQETARRKGAVPGSGRPGGC